MATYILLARLTPRRHANREQQPARIFEVDAKSSAYRPDTSDLAAVQPMNEVSDLLQADRRAALVQARCALGITHAGYLLALTRAQSSPNVESRDRERVEARRLIGVAIDLRKRAKQLELELDQAEISGAVCSGVSTTEIVTTTPSTLACTKLPCTSRSSDSYRKIRDEQQKRSGKPNAARCARW